MSCVPDCSVATCEAEASLKLVLEDGQGTYWAYRCPDHVKRDPLVPVVDREELND